MDDPGTDTAGIPRPDIVLDPQEVRVLGSLIEKEATTPDQYPMTINGLRLACNQASNRDPVVDYDEATVERVLRRLADRGLAKMVHRPGDRVVKYKHALDVKLELDPASMALLAVLMLRGIQTPGELRQRSSRYVEFPSLVEVEQTLDSLVGRTPPLLDRIERRPGQKEARYRHRLSGDHTDLPQPHQDTGMEPWSALDGTSDRRDAGPGTISAGNAPAVSDPAVSDPAVSDPAVSDLADEVAELRRRFERLLEELGVDDV